MRRAIAVFLAAGAPFYPANSVQAEPTVIVGNHVVQPNMPGQTIILQATGIAPNTVNGISFTFSINNGGPNFGGALGPRITDIDVDSGPSIWNPPNSAGHNPPGLYFDPGGQLANVEFLTTTGFVNADSGILLTLTIDNTGLDGPEFSTWDLWMVGGSAIDETFGPSHFTGVDVVGTFVNGAILVVPEPSSLFLGLIAICGFAAIVDGRRRARRVVAGS
jgi:hypothetical protein